MGRLDIRICGARNLPDTETIGEPDPYCVVKLEGATHRTSTVDDTTDPVWNEVFKFQVADPNSSQLRFELWNKNTLSDEFLGCYHLSISGLQRGVVSDNWYLLQQCKTNAELHVRMMAHDFGVEPQGPPPQVELGGYEAPPPEQQPPIPQYQGAYPPGYQPPPPPPQGFQPPPPQPQQYFPPPQQFHPPKPATAPPPPRQQFGGGQNWPQHGGVYQIISRNAPDKVLGCAGGGGDNGTQLVLWDQDGTPNQSWRASTWGNGYWSFNPLHAENKSLDTNNGCGQTCHLWDRGDMNNMNQNFRLEPTDSGYFMMLRQNDNAALDVAGFRNDNGATLHAWADQTRAPNQQWAFRRIG